MNHRNIAASVRARLLNIAKTRNEIFAILLIRYTIERFLYRLSISGYSNRFILKGAALFNYWRGEPHRPTLDADFSIINIISIAEAEELVREVCSLEAVDDGLNFLIDSVSAKDIRENNEYQGIRVRFKAELDNAIIPVQIDIGFGDAVIPPPVLIEYPALLEFPSPKLMAYSPENCIAEKIQIIFEKGIINSRMKDYYDIWFIINSFAIDGTGLQEALIETFKRRKTALTADTPVGLSSEFSDDIQKQAQWQGFLKKTGNESAPALDTVTETIKNFITPVIASSLKKEPFNLKWQDNRGWNK